MGFCQNPLSGAFLTDTLLDPRGFSSGGGYSCSPVLPQNSRNNGEQFEFEGLVLRLVYSARRLTAPRRSSRLGWSYRIVERTSRWRISILASEMLPPVRRIKSVQQ